MERKIDFHKAGAILIRDRKILLTHEQGKKFYVSPGGVIEDGETPQQAVVRELMEEIGVKVFPKDLEMFGTFYAPTAGAEDKWLQMDVFKVVKWRGEPKPMSGNEVIDDLLWINSQNIPENIQIGSIFLHDVLPKLKTMDLID